MKRKRNGVNSFSAISTTSTFKLVHYCYSTTMIDLVLQALTTLFSPDHFPFLLLGVLLGLIIGVFPGLGGIAGLSLLLACNVPESGTWRVQ